MPQSESRTHKSIKNSTAALIMYFINLVMQFYSRKIFLEYLGEDVLGLNTTAMTLLQFLNLAELGIGSAVAFSLYKPIHNKETNDINDIITLQGFLYKKIAVFIIIGAGILMCFFPLIFKKITLPLWYAYASFGVLLFSSLLSYFVNYKQVILSASQQEYKIIYSYKVIILIKVFCQIIAVRVFSYGYVWWLILEFIFAIAASAILHKVTIQTFPFLKKSKKTFAQLRIKFKAIETKVKQLLFHKLAGFALLQVSPLIIYAYSDLKLVTYYGNYLILITGIQALMSSLFNSMNSSIGDLLIEKDSKKNYSIFKELFSSRFLLISLFCFSVYLFADSFVALWIGNEYIMSRYTLILMICGMFFTLLRGTTDAYINGAGLFGDIWAPIIECSINIGLSVLLGFYWGINGVLLGVCISAIIIIGIWKPYYMFNNCMPDKFTHYWILFLMCLIIGFSSYFITNKVLILVSPNQICESWLELIKCGVIFGIVFILVEGTLLYVMPTGFNEFISRFSKLLFRRLNK